MYAIRSYYEVQFAFVGDGGLDARQIDLLAADGEAEDAVQGGFQLVRPGDLEHAARLAAPAGEDLGLDHPGRLEGDGGGAGRIRTDQVV